MMILDTHIISELLRPVPAGQVERWLSEQDGPMIHFTTTGEAELWHGVALLPAGKRRTALSRAIEGMLEEDFRDRILPFDRSAARAYAAIAAERQRAAAIIAKVDAAAAQSRASSQ